MNKSQVMELILEVVVIDRFHCIYLCSQHSAVPHVSAVDKPEFMGRPPDHPWWKTGSPESLLGCPNYFDLSFKDIFLVINTKFACFLFNQALIESWVAPRATPGVMLDRPTK